MDITSLDKFPASTPKVKMEGGESLEIEINLGLPYEVPRTKTATITISLYPLPSGMTYAAIHLPMDNAFVAHPLNERDVTRNAIVLIRDEYNPSKIELVVNPYFPTVVDSFVSLKHIMDCMGVTPST